MKTTAARRPAPLLEAAAPDGGPVTRLPDWGITRVMRDIEIRYHTAIRYRVHYRLDRYLLHFAFGSAALAARFRDTAIKGRLRIGTLCVVPPEAPAQLEVNEPVEFLCVAVARRRFEHGYGGALRVAGAPMLNYLIDAGISALMTEVRRALLADYGDNDAYFEALVDAVVARMATRKTAWAQRAAATGGESGAIRSALAHIDAHLEEPLTVAELAAVAGLSRHHFTRVFKAATGSAPHAYLVRRRVLRARELIEGSNLPLADIALQTGFSSQAHMSDVFRQQLGVSPARLRRR